MRVIQSQMGPKRRRFFSTLVGLSALLFMSSACQFGGSFEEARCDSKADCAGEAICVEGFCALPLSEDPSTPDAGEDLDVSPDVHEDDIREDPDVQDAPDTDTSNGPVIDRIELDPSALNLTVGRVENVVPTAFDPNGDIVDVVDLDDFRWTSSAPNIAVPVGAGAIRALDIGEASITVSYGDVSATILVQVAPANAEQIEIFPGTIALSEQGQYLAQARAYDANSVLITNPEIVWTVADEGVATVDDTGLIVAVAAGSTEVTVAMLNAPSVTATAEIHVNALIPASALISPSNATITAGRSIQFEVFDDDFNRVDNSNITWSSTDSTTASVSTSGRVEGLKEGAATIQADVNGISNPLTAIVTIQAQQVVRVEVTPVSDSVRIGESTFYSAKAFAANGDELTGSTSFVWSVGEPEIAESLGAGEIKGKKAGATVVIATVGAISDYAGIQVEPHPVDTVTLTPASTTLDIGEDIELDVELFDSNGDVIEPALRVVRWTSNNEGVAVVDGTGKVTAISDGTATITAISEGKSATAEVTVVPDEVINQPPVAFAQNVTVVANTSLTFNLTAYDPEHEALTFSLHDEMPLAEGVVNLDDIDAGIVTYTPPSPPFVGTTSFKFRVEDLAGNLSDMVQVTLVVSEGNTPPTAIATVAPMAGSTCDDFILDASGSSDMPLPLNLSYQWSIEEPIPVGSTVPLTDATEVEATLSPGTPGTYIIKLVVTDAQRASDTDFVIVEVVDGGAC